MPRLEDNNKLRAELADSEHELSQRTRERDDFQLKLIESDQELTAVHLEFTENTRKQASNLAVLARNLALVETKFNDSKQSLIERTEELAGSNAEVKALRHEQSWYVNALRDLKDPIKRATQILEYLAVAEISPERQSEILIQIIDANKSMLSGSDSLAKIALAWGQRTNELTKHAKDLAQSNTEMKARMQQREDFVVALTHDLKNPLIGATRILELYAAGSFSGDERNKILNQVIESNKTMLRMIWNMLDVYRYESGALVPNLAEVNLSMLLKQCLIGFSFSILEKKLKLILDECNQVPLIRTDSILLQRILVNLLDNAVKFSPEGGELTVKTYFNDNELRISIKDCGPGLSEIQLKQLFQRYWQTESGRRKGIGTGLGLFSSKQIMDALGGQIDCLSTEHGGTTFELTFQPQHWAPG